MIELSKSQQRMLASGITAFAFVLLFSVVAGIVFALVKLLGFAAPAIVPVLLGFFLALFFKPYYRWWKRMVRNPSLALVIMLLTVFVPLGFLLWYAGAVMVDQLTNLLRQGPSMVAHVQDWFQASFPRFKALLDNLGVPYGQLGELYTNYGGAAMKAGSSALKCLAGIVSALVTVIFFVFFLMTRDRRGGEIVSSLPFLKEDTRVFLAAQIDAFIGILVSFFQRQTVICLIEGVMYGSGFWLVGLPYGFLLGFALGVMNIIPLFGSVICLPIALPLAYFSHGGSGVRLLMVLAVWAAGQLVDGYLITPKIQGDRTGLGYAGVIFSFFFWATVLGPVLGMLLAIPLSAFCVVLWRAIRERYFK